MLTGILAISDGYALRQRALPPEYGLPDASVLEHTYVVGVVLPLNV
jgi:hypothetical protein